MMIRLGPVLIYAGNALDCLGDAVYYGGQTEEFCVDDAGRESLTGRCYVESEKVPVALVHPVISCWTAWKNKKCENDNLGDGDYSVIGKYCFCRQCRALIVLAKPIWPGYGVQLYRLRFRLHS